MHLEHDKPLFRYCSLHVYRFPSSVHVSLDVDLNRESVTCGVWGANLPSSGLVFVRQQSNSAECNHFHGIDAESSVRTFVCPGRKTIGLRRDDPTMADNGVKDPNKKSTYVNTNPLHRLTHHTLPSSVLNQIKAVSGPFLFNPTKSPNQFPPLQNHTTSP